MGLSDKMFCKGNLGCPPRSDCGRPSNRAYFTTLFEKEWEVFVIKRDKTNDRFDWYTLCCDAAEPMNTTAELFSDLSCQVPTSPA